jgi:hypothetical protein
MQLKLQITGLGGWTNELQGKTPRQAGWAHNYRYAQQLKDNHHLQPQKRQQEVFTECAPTSLAT